ncbi:MAG: hypothetical protein R3B82_04095 [Sandaracinaceae bacterium]
MTDRRVIGAGLLLFSWTLQPAWSAAQDDELVVPPPPTTSAPPTSPPSPAQALTPDSPSDAPPAVSPPSVSDEVVAPLLTAAEQDLAAGRHALAIARTALVSQALPEATPLRIRSDGLRLLAEQRLSGNASPPSIDEVLAPIVAQAELDLRSGNVVVAVPRLDFALARLPEGSALRARVASLRALAVSSPGAAPGTPPVLYAPPPPPMSAPPPPPRPPRDPDERGTGEAVELYITGAMLGALTGGYIPYVASEQTAGSVTYTLSIIGGAGLLTVGVISLDVTGALRTGIAPTISSGIRFGFANGMLALGLGVANGLSDPGAQFTLVWSGAAVGALTGIGVGFGLRPRVHEERLVESVGIWGGLLGTSIAMMTNYDDATTGLMLSLVGLDAGILAGVAAVAGGGRLSTRRTLFIDLGFLAGFGLGMAAPALYYYATQSTNWELPPFGVASAIGAVGGWVLLYLVTDGMAGPEEEEAPPVNVAIAPTEGGGVVTIYGAL